MKINFALSLSFEGISLLGRVPGGWAVLGQAQLDSDDLPGALRSLRDIADARGASNGQVKLVIPNEQIRYLSLPKPETDQDAAIRRALDAATPYAVSDLVYDFSGTGGTLMVAAVARETLDEAESFARDHSFEPVCFVARAPGGQFAGEVFFGAAKSWVGAVPTRDVGAMTIVPLPETPDDMPPEKPVAKPQSPAAVPVTADEEPVGVPKDSAAAQTLSPRDGSSTAPQTAGSGKAERASASPYAGAPAPVAPAKTEPRVASDRGPAPKSPAAKKPRAAQNKRPEPAETLATGGDEDANSALSPGAARMTETLAVPEPEAGQPVSPGLAPSREPATATADFTSLRASRDVPQYAGVDSPAIDPPRTDLPNGVALRVTPRPAEADQPIPETAVPATAPRQGTVAPPDNRGSSGVGPAVSHPGLTRQSVAASQPTVKNAAKAAPQSLVKGFFSRRAQARREPSAASIPVKPISTSGGSGSATSASGKITAHRPNRQAVKAPSATGEAGAMSAREAERLRMTVFGARQKERQVGGKPRFLGVVLTLALLLALIGVAAWASVYLDDGLARFFRRDATQQIETARLPTASITPDTPGTGAATDPELQPEIELAALSTDLPSTETGAAPAPLSAPRRAQVLTQDEADAAYADSGIWQRAPVAPSEPRQTRLDDLYVASIDPEVQEFDAIALPVAQMPRTDIVYSSPNAPLPADVAFDLDERGFVRATTEGAVNPDGILIFAGLPPVVPPPRDVQQALSKPLPTPEDSAATAAEQDRLLAFRPKSRPENLIERNERATRSGVSLAELQAMRPKLRPDTAKVQDEADVAATELAIAQSVKPSARPDNIKRIVESARTAPPEQQAVQAAAAVPRIVAPSIPSNTSVAQQATVRNAINLRQLNLIGIYGAPSSRSALVRMSNGRYQKVKVGDSIDGGRVAAIGENELRYTKSGRNIVLKMPQG